MNSVSSFLPPASATATTSAAGTTPTRRTPTAFEVNSAEFGPVGATAVGIAASAADAASSTVSLSASGLERFEKGAESALHAVEGVFSDAGSAVASFGHHVADDVKKAYGAVADTVSSVISGVEDAAKSTEDAVTSVASSLGDAASYVKDEVTSAISDVSKYVAAGINAVA